MTEDAGRILVTGAGGFIGRHLVPYLAGMGYDLTALIRRPPFPGGNVDILAMDDIAEHIDKLRLENYRTIIHLAGRAHMGGGRRAFERQNVDLSRRLAEAALKGRVRKIIFLSSIGAQRAQELLDGGAPENTLWAQRPYQISKLKAERMLAEMLAGSAVKLVILRPPLIYAADAPGNVARLLSALKRRRFLPLGAVTHNSRAFLAMPHLLDAIAMSLSHADAAGLYALADNERPSTANFIGMIADALDVRARLWPCPPALLRAAFRLLGRRLLEESLLDDLRIDDGAIRQQLGWRPRYEMATALRLALAGSEAGLHAFPASGADRNPGTA